MDSSTDPTPFEVRRLLERISAEASAELTRCGLDLDSPTALQLKTLKDACDARRERTASAEAPSPVLPAARPARRTGSHGPAHVKSA